MFTEAVKDKCKQSLYNLHQCIISEDEKAVPSGGIMVPVGLFVH